MEYILDAGVTFIRSVGSIAFLFVLTKIMGAKQISQLNFFDYIIGISIGSIVAILAVDRDIHFSHPLVSMAALALVDVLIGFLGRKSIGARRVFNGTPTIVIHNGRLLRDNMKRIHYDINELLSMCRIKGFYNVADIHCAILETNGDLSILPRSDRRPVQPSDLGLAPVQEGLLANVIIDGKVMPNNLKNIGKNEQWLKQKLKEQGAGKIGDILLATCDDTGAVSVYRIKENAPKKTCLE